MAHANVKLFAVTANSPRHEYVGVLSRGEEAFGSTTAVICIERNGHLTILVNLPSSQTGPILTSDL